MRIRKPKEWLGMYPILSEGLGMHPILSEVTNSHLADTSGGLHGMRSAGAIKTKVWCTQQKFNPMPKISIMKISWISHNYLLS